MGDKTTGGSAFGGMRQIGDVKIVAGAGGGMRQIGDVKIVAGGLTIRDCPEIQHRIMVATMAYEFADAMIAERDK